jgi:hypothetical protein
MVLNGYFSDLVYLISLLVIATITAYAYDGDVWLRDIDTSPSPFPIPILISYVFRRRAPSDDLHAASVCLPGCNCAVKLQRTPISSWSESHHGSLVRIPREAERRGSINVVLG